MLSPWPIASQILFPDYRRQRRRPGDPHEGAAGAERSAEPNSGSQAAPAASTRCERQRTQRAFSPPAAPAPRPVGAGPFQASGRSGRRETGVPERHSRDCTAVRLRWLNGRHSDDLCRHVPGRRWIAESVTLKNCDVLEAQRRIPFSIRSCTSSSACSKAASRWW